MKTVIKFFSVIPILAVIGISIASPVHGEEIDVFGPQTFSKVKGKPRTETVQFNVPVDIEGTLIILNGGEENAPRKKRVSEGKITLNDEKIVPQKIDHDKDKDKDRDRKHKRHKHKKIKLNKKVSRLELPIVLKAGSNTLSVKLKGKRGSKISAQIIFDDQAPTAAFTANSTDGAAPLDITFDASASTDPDDSIASYDWDFGGGETATGNSTSHTFTNPGDFTVTLTVTDQFGLTNQTTASVTVINTPPVATFAATPSNGAAPLNVNFDATGSTDPNDSIASYNWDFGDGATATNISPSHSYITPGTYTATLTVTDTFGLTDQTTASITVTNLPPVASFTATPFEGTVPLNVSFDASGSTDPNDVIASFDWNFGDGETATGITPTHTYSTEGMFTVTLTVTDSFGATNQSTLIIDALPDISIPGIIPDAPSLASAIISDVAANTSFLYTGANPIQTGVTPGTIEAVRAAVVRGQVFTRDGNPLEGVTVSVMDHPEFGQTLSRADGFYDMAVNGDTQLVMDFIKPGFLPGRRKIDVPRQDFSITESIALIPLDPQFTVVDLANATAPTLAQGSVQTDADGSRQAAVMFPQGTTAEMVMPDGSTQPLSSITVRATEYTVGENGPMAMPALLPPSTRYTYALELSVDEAIAAGAESVQFNQPIPAYVDNFLNFPAGVIVPSGFYDRKQAKWLASDNGVVIDILSVTGGLADLDVDGSGTAADATLLASLGITNDERQTLANKYAPGASLWRVPVKHFSFFDWNWSHVAQNAQPKERAASVNNNLDVCDECPNRSTVQVQAQILGEQIPVAGTPFNLSYATDRTPGYRAGSTLNIPVTGPTFPSITINTRVTIQVMGRKFEIENPPEPNLSVPFVWDGLDAYGRPVSGSVNAKVSIAYEFQAFYSETSLFGATGNGSALVKTRRAYETAKSYTVKLNSTDLKGYGLGGWFLDQQHYYEPFDKVLYLGNGRRKSTQSVNRTINTIGGNTSVVDRPRDGLNIFKTNFATVRGGPLLDSEGNLYLMALGNSDCKIFKVGDDGILNEHSRFTQCGVPNWDIDAEGNIYIAYNLNRSQVVKVNPNGVKSNFTKFFSSNPRGFEGDGGPASEAKVNNPMDVAVDSQGNVYIADTGNWRLRKVDVNGIINTVAIAKNIRSVTVDAQDNVYFSDSDRFIYKMDTQGIVTTIAGNGTSTVVEGTLATETGFPTAEHLNVDAQGNLFFSNIEGGIPNFRIRKIDTNGVFNSIAGTGTPGPFNGDDIPAIAANISVRGMTIDSEGAVYIQSDGRFQKIEPAFPGFRDDNMLIASDDGSEFYVFNNTGRHLRTLNTLTGAVVYDFAYDTSGRLTAVTDGDGNVTTVQRDGEGNPVSITSADGQVTTLGLDANGYINDITNPNNESDRFEYTAAGLMTKRTDPRLNDSLYTYDAEGRLLTDSDAAGGSLTLTRSGDNDIYTVDATTGLGRTSSFLVENFSAGGNLRTVTDPNGLVNTTQLGLDNSKTITTPDGTVTRTTVNPDPRFGMQSPLSNLTVTTPGGLVSSLTTSRTASLADPDDVFSITSQVDMLLLNGRAFASVYDATQMKFTDTTPEGRVTTSFVDTQGRILKEQVPGLEDTDFTYDIRGRLTGVTQGVAGPTQRTSSIAYDANGFVQSVTDPLNRSVQFQYDPTGRVTRQVLPDLREINFTYDANGNVSSITPPGRPAHGFQYTAVDLESEYAPPAIGLPEHRTLFAYNFDKQLTTITRPDLQTVTFNYDVGGRVDNFVIPRGMTTFNYDPVTGNVSSIAAPDGGVQSFTYDGSLLLSTTWAGTVAGSVERTYDNDFRVTTRSVNGGNTIAFGYDNDSLLTSAGSESLSYDATNGLLTGSTLGVVTDNYNYNGFAEVATYTANVNASPVYQTQFARDKLGRITQKVETVQGVTHTYDYFYDVAGRLIAINKDGVSHATYTYDSNGNRTNDGAIYDDQDRLINNNSASFAYTDNGELLSKTDASGTTNYVYDVLGNLLSVDVANGSLIEYIVDSSNRRIGRKVDGTLEKGWLYKDQLNPVAELDGSGAVVSRFVYASRANIPDYIIKGGNTYRIISDHLGSPRLVVDIATGLVAQQIEFNEFGNVLADTNPGFLPFGFAGGLYDATTGLTRFGARDYDPTIGRWTNKDPIGFAGGDTNLYGYVVNDPVNLVDPEGLFLPAVIAVGEVAAAVSTILTVGETLFDFINSFFADECPGNQGEKPKAGDKIFRVFGGGSGAFGNSFTTIDPRTVENFRSEAGLPNKNAGRFVLEATIIDATGIKTRSALPFDGNPGGLIEVVVPNPKTQLKIDRVSGVNPEF